MNNSINYHPQIRDYLLNRLTPKQEELFEIWLLETHGAQEEVELERAMLEGAKELTDIACFQGKKVAKERPKKHSYSIFLPSVAAAAVIAFSITLLWPKSQNISYQEVYIEQLRSHEPPKVAITSKDDSSNYQFIVALDDMDPPAFDVTISDNNTKQVIFNEIVKPNANDELVIYVKKSTLKSNEYRLDIKPLIYQQSVSFILQVSP